MTASKSRERVNKKDLAAEVKSLRPYKSRTSRPCDFCRKRKTCCIIKDLIPCTVCTSFNNGRCTFLEGPVKRNRIKKGRKASKPKPNENTFSVVGQPMFEKPIIHERPMLDEKPVFDEKPAFYQKQIFDEKPIFDQKPMFDQKAFESTFSIQNKSPLEPTTVKMEDGGHNNCYNTIDFQNDDSIGLSLSNDTSSIHTVSNSSGTFQNLEKSSSQRNSLNLSIDSVSYSFLPLSVRGVLIQSPTNSSHFQTDGQTLAQQVQLQMSQQSFNNTGNSNNNTNTSNDLYPYPPMSLAPPANQSFPMNPTLSLNQGIPGNHSLPSTLSPTWALFQFDTYNTLKQPPHPKMSLDDHDSLYNQITNIHNPNGNNNPSNINNNTINNNCVGIAPSASLNYTFVEYPYKANYPFNSNPDPRLFNLNSPLGTSFLTNFPLNTSQFM